MRLTQELDYEKVINENMGLICQEVNRGYNKLSPQGKRLWERQDLEQEVMLQLLTALPKYDPDKGAKVSTYIGMVTKRKMANIVIDSYSFRRNNNGLEPISIDEQREIMNNGEVSGGANDHLMFQIENPVCINEDFIVVWEISNGDLLLEKIVLEFLKGNGIHKIAQTLNLTTQEFGKKLDILIQTAESYLFEGYNESINNLKDGIPIMVTKKVIKKITKLKKVTESDPGEEHESGTKKLKKAKSAKASTAKKSTKPRTRPTGNLAAKFDESQTELCDIIMEHVEKAGGVEDAPHPARKCFHIPAGKGKKRIGCIMNGKGSGIKYCVAWLDGKEGLGANAKIMKEKGVTFISEQHCNSTIITTKKQANAIKLAIKLRIDSFDTD